MKLLFVAASVALWIFVGVAVARADEPNRQTEWDSLIDELIDLGVIPDRYRYYPMSEPAVIEITITTDSTSFSRSTIVGIDSNKTGGDISRNQPHEHGCFY